MRELTDYERGFLRAAEKRGGEWTIQGNYDQPQMGLSRRSRLSGSAFGPTSYGRGRVCSDRKGQRRFGQVKRDDIPQGFQRFCALITAND
jgi:hypothetical protein